MKKFITLLLLAVTMLPMAKAQQIQVKNPFIWADAPDPDIIRVGDYYYLVTTTMHLFPGGPIMRSKDLVHWETVSYLFDEIKDTPRYDLKEGTVYGRGQWATSLRYHKGTFWALFVANDDPHKSMVFKTDDPAKGWKLHSRLPAYHDSSLFFDDDDRVYVFSGSGDIHLVELTSDLTAEKPGGIRKKLELNGRPMGLHEGSRVIKHDGMYYLLCISWPRTGRQEICYRSKNIEGPYESKVILKSDFGGFPLAGQGTIVDGKHGEWYGVIFQDRGGCGRVLTIEPCNWIDGWPMLGNLSDGKIPETLALDGDCECHKTPDYAVIEKDYQWNHNYIKADFDKNKIISYMVGRQLDKVYPTIEKDIGEVIMRATNISAPPMVKDVSFALRQGEILGISGLAGDEQNTLLLQIFGGFDGGGHVGTFHHGDAAVGDQHLSILQKQFVLGSAGQSNIHLNGPNTAIRTGAVVVDGALALGSIFRQAGPADLLHILQKGHIDALRIIDPPGGIRTSYRLSTQLVSFFYSIDRHVSGSGHGDGFSFNAVAVGL